MTGYWIDIAAITFFVVEWTVYAYTLEHTEYGRDSLSARMHIYREVWIRNLLDRETRMVDMQIMASLQNGTAFFASSSLIAIGGGLALLRATNDALAVLGAMPPASQKGTPEAEAHVIRTTRLFESAGQHFNRGQRSFFFALGYLGWFVSPWVLFVTTAMVVIVTWRRQFASNAWKAMGS